MSKFLPFRLYFLLFSTILRSNCEDDVSTSSPLPSLHSDNDNYSLIQIIDSLLNSTTIRPTTDSVTINSSIALLSQISSSSSSAEDQLTPLLLGTASHNGQSTCVTCPQTVCTLSKVSYIRKTIYHNWRVDGLPDYLTYLEKFHAPFQLQNDVSFNMTSPNDGQWTFTLSRTLPAYISTEQSESLDLRVTYKYASEARIPPRISFDLWLSAHVEDEYVTLPSQISSYPTYQPVPTRSGSPLEYEMFTWTYLFLWSDIQSKLVTLIESAGVESQLVEFKFVINSYQDGNPSSADANCGGWNSGESTRGHKNHRHSHQSSSLELNSGNNATWPPFLANMYALMKDDKYVDLIVKSGDEEFQIHRVVAAYSSPVLATMIYNLTYEKSESLLDFGEDIGSDVVEDLIRYMYLGKVEDLEEIADRLIVAATTYGFPALKKQCESVLIKQVKTENAFNMYALGAEVGSMRLKRRAFNIMKENKSKIVAQSEEFRKLSVHHPDVMYELFLS